MSKLYVSFLFTRYTMCSVPKAKLSDNFQASYQVPKTSSLHRRRNPLKIC